MNFTTAPIIILKILFPLEIPLEGLKEIVPLKIVFKLKTKLLILK